MEYLEKVPLGIVKLVIGIALALITFSGSSSVHSLAITKLFAGVSYLLTITSVYLRYIDY